MTIQLPDLWHYPRGALAQQTLALLVEGPSKALTLFGPRRMGKTTFLLKDIGPLAETMGHRVIYASFWSAPVAPLAVLLHALESSRRAGTVGDRARTMLVSLTPKLKLSGPLPGTSVEASVDLSELGGKPRADLLLYLDDVLGRLANPKRPTLLLIDEVQELARSRDNLPLVHALRTSLDKRGQGLATIFTGSSREGLKAIFSARDAPFFHFAMPIELPVMDDPFVDHMLKAFQTATRRKFARSEALSAFETLGRNPEYFRGLVDLMMQNPSFTLPMALGELRLRLALDQGYVANWLALTPLQRGVLRALAAGADRPFARDTLERIARLAGIDVPTRSHVQKAIARLSRLGLVDQWGERWTIAETEFAAWVASRPVETAGTLAVTPSARR
jgi:uncharacterized protein